MIDKRVFEKDRDCAGAKGIVFIGQKMLVYRRDTNTNRFPLYIDLPGGGKESDESPFETYKREVKEEFGINIRENEVVYAKQYMSSLEPTKELYYIVIKTVGTREEDIVFGDEGIEYYLFTPEEYLRRKDIIPRHKDRVQECLLCIKGF